MSLAFKVFTSAREDVLAGVQKSSPCLLALLEGKSGSTIKRLYWTRSVLQATSFQQYHFEAIMSM